MPKAEHDQLQGMFQEKHIAQLGWWTSGKSGQVAECSEWNIPPSNVGSVL